MTVQEWIDQRSQSADVRQMTLAGFYIELLEQLGLIIDDLEPIFYEPMSGELITLLDHRVDVWKMEQVI